MALRLFRYNVEPMPASGAARLLSKNGATVALNHKVRGRSGPYLVTLVGEIPVQTCAEYCFVGVATGNFRRSGCAK